MILTALLSAIVIWFLFYGTVNLWLLGAFSAVFGTAVGMLGRHAHGGFLPADNLAQRSGLNPMNPALKVGGCLALLMTCICSGTAVGLTLTVLAAVLQVVVGKMHFHAYLKLLALPANFLLLSTLALLFEWSFQPSGVLNLGLFGGWLSIAALAQAKTAMVLARALGAVSCLFLLSLSTPIDEIISVLERAHLPSVVINLMYLIYRYLFLLYELYESMRSAAESRLGFQNYSRSLRSTGLICANLLARSFQKANASFDAMESRCFDEKIGFLTQEKPLNKKHLSAVAAVICGTAAIAVLEKIR